MVQHYATLCYDAFRGNIRNLSECSRLPKGGRIFELEGKTNKEGHGAQCLRIQTLGIWLSPNLVFSAYQQVIN